MGLGNALGNIGRAFAPQFVPPRKSIATPPFIPSQPADDTDDDQYAPYQDESDGPPPPSPPPPPDHPDWNDETGAQPEDQNPPISLGSQMGGNAPAVAPPSGLIARGPGAALGGNGAPPNPPAPVPPPAPNTPGGQKIGLARQIGGALIQGAGSMVPGLAPAARAIGERVAQGSYPTQEREYERQLALQKAQADLTKEQATAEETRQRGRFYGQQTDTMAAEGKRGPKANYISIPGGGLFNADSGEWVKEPPAKLPPDVMELTPEQGRALKIKPDSQGRYILPKEGIGPYVTKVLNPTPAPTAESEKIKFQNTLSKLQLAGELPANANTDSSARDKAIRGAQSLTPQEKADAIAWAGANPNPAAQVTGGVLRIEALAATKPITVIDSQSGQAQTMNMDEFNTANRLAPGRYVQAGIAVPAMSKEAAFKDINYNIRNARSAISALDDMDAGTRAQLAIALKDPDPKSAISAFLTGAAGSTMTPQQEDAVIALRNLSENAMALRQLAGFGQGSDQMRAAIQATLPSGRSPNKGYALKQLNQFERIVQNLHTGVPGLGKPAAQEGSQGSNNQPTANPNPNGYIVGHVYGGLTYLGPDPNQQSSWRK